VVHDNEIRVSIIERIKQLQGELSKTKHGSRVLTKIMKQYPMQFNGIENG
jgi:DNA anti-recombination protein RmuC